MKILTSQKESKESKALREKKEREALASNSGKRKDQPILTT